MVHFAVVWFCPENSFLLWYNFGGKMARYYGTVWARKQSAAVVQFAVVVLAGK